MTQSSLARILRPALTLALPCLMVVMGPGAASSTRAQPAGPVPDWAPAAKAERETQKASLAEYAPVAGDPGKYQVPVSKAMDMLVADNTLLAPIQMVLAVPANAEERGAQIFGKILPCYTCHAVEAADTVYKLGPRLHGRFGKTVKFTGGETTFDDAYVKESVQNPLAKISEGFLPVMPPLGVTDEQAADLIAYLKSLK